MNAALARGLYWWAQAGRREPVANVLRELERSARWPAEELRALQQRRIARLLRHAFQNVPYYRQTWTAAGFRSGDWDRPEALASLPVLEKRVVQEWGEGMRARRKTAGHWARTSGSSGTPVKVLRSQDSWAHAHANQFRAYHWHGLEVGERYAYFWGLALEPRGRRQAGLKDWVFNRARCSAFTLDRSSAALYYGELRRRPAAFALGYPSAISQFAQELRTLDLDGKALRWRAVLTTAEVLHPHQRALLRETFGCPVVDLYGCAEVGVAGIECAHGGRHVPIESVCLEWLGDDRNGEAREVLLTDLHNFAQPMIRYRVGDLVDPGPASCACGRALPLIGSVRGRAGDTIVLPDGRQVNANLPSYVFKHHAEAGSVREYQFVQFSDGTVELRLKPGPAFGPSTAVEIGEEVAKALGLAVRVKLLDRFERSARGKHRDFVRAEEA